jgi:ACS family hexuronate transporter-like MFS transporter
MTLAPDSTPNGQPVSPWRWWVCLLLMLATVINYMDRMALNQMAHRIKAAFSLTNTQYSLLESSFSLAFALGALTTGFVVDRFSVRWVYPLMVLGWSAAGVLTGFAPGYWFLLTCRFLLGVFEAGNWPCGIRTTKAVLRPDERSLGNSLFQSGTALGAVITPMLVLVLLRWADPNEGHRHAVMAVGGGSYAAFEPPPTDTWRIPFRVIGSLGVVWVVLWFVTVPGRMVRRGDEGSGDSAAGQGGFTQVFRDRRFWGLLIAVVALNVTWHGYRTWLPLYLVEQRKYTEAEMSRFTTLYYLIADVGSWTVGFATLGVVRRGGVGLHATRLAAFAVCALLTLGTVAVPFLPDGWPLQFALLAVAFGGLGLFPTYFALSQELSSRHQGKVTGTLGFAAHMSLALVFYPIEGIVCDATKSYEWVLGAVGAAPIIGFGLLLCLWPPHRDAPPSS